MKMRGISKVLAKRFLQLIAVLVALLSLVTAWWVIGPASRPHASDPAGVPNDAWPELNASLVEDLPLACSPVVEDNQQGPRHHRNHVYLAKYGDLYLAMFTSWLGAEDQPGSEVQYAVSRDAVTWSTPETLAMPAPEQGVIARGFVERDGKLFAWYAAHTGDTFFRSNKNKSNRNIAIMESEWTGPKGGW
ncbi:MAG: hypothetical protein WAT93_04235, partial [Pontixanthobacter sp.]